VKIHAHRDVCIGAGMCVLIAPQLFTQDDEDGRVRVVADEPPSAERQAADQAVAECPSGALSLSGNDSTPPRT
jgi:ferredoxin